MAILTMEQIRRFKVPAGSLTMWWLGQIGFIVKSPQGTIIAIDPYLSNSCKAVGDQCGFDMDRMVPPPKSPPALVGIDAYAITHSHQDHLDPETLGPYRAAGGIGPYIAPPETIEKLHALGIPNNQMTMIWPNKTVRTGDLLLRATFAIPLGGDDLTHVGYLVSVPNGPTFYVTGDTGYHEILAISIAEHHPDVMAVVINGTFRNMGPAEAARLVQQLNPKVAIPCHYELFRANLTPPQTFYTNLQLLGIGEKYKVIEHGIPFTFPDSASCATTA